jgi:hypothetical protein
VLGLLGVAVPIIDRGDAASPWFWIRFMDSAPSGFLSPNADPVLTQLFSLIVLKGKK